ncbi:MAG: hypothetical protein ABIF77_20230 [bacterium]
MDLETLAATPSWEWPDDAVDTLFEVLADDQAEVQDRALAVELAGDYAVIEDRLAGAILAIGRNADEPEELRALALIAFGPALEHADMEGFGDPEQELLSEAVVGNVLQVLQALYLDTANPILVRRMALEASAHAPQEWHGDAISEAYASEEHEWRITAVFCMRFVNGFEAQILEALDYDDLGLAFLAVGAAGNWQVDAAWDRVVTFATDVDYELDLRLEAIEAVACLRPAEAAEVLAPLLEDKDEDIVEAASEALDMAEALQSMEEEGEETEH